MQDVRITGQRVVKDQGQNILRDAYQSDPKTTLYFRSQTAQGEQFSFTSEVASWALDGEANAAETFSAGIRPRDEAYTAPDDSEGSTP